MPLCVQGGCGTCSRLYQPLIQPSSGVLLGALHHSPCTDTCCPGAQYGWGVAAIITPTVLLITGVAFFGLVLGSGPLTPTLASIGLTPLMAAVLVRPQTWWWEASAAGHLGAVASVQQSRLVRSVCIQVRQPKK